MERLKGLVAAPFTPMDANDEVDISKIQPYYEMLSRNGVIGAFICGSTGEGVSLTFDEKKAITDEWVRCASGNPHFKIILHLGGTCLSECIALAVHAAEVGIDAVACTAPNYFKPSSIGVLANFCAAIASAVPQTPFYYYHIPVLTGVGFPMLDLLKEVDGKIPNFVGIKYTHEDFMDFLSCVRYKQGAYDMLWGRDENMLSALVLGADGAVGSTYNYAAPLYHELRKAFSENRLEDARAWQQQSIDMIRLLSKYGGISVGKAFMKSIGYDCGRFRLPVSNMSEASFNDFTNDLKQINFSDYCSK